MAEATTLQLDAELAQAVQVAADWRGMSLQEFVISAVGRAAQMDADLAAFVQDGIDEADRGELIDQADVEAWFFNRHRSAAR